jgi:glycosyltransferase involved in cell wall biosynthesis
MHFDDKLKVVHYYARAFEERSGVTAAMAAWAEAQIEAGHDVLVTGARLGTSVASPQDYRRTRTRPFAHAGKSRATYAPGPRLRRLIAVADIVVLHEGWVFSNMLAAIFCRFSGTPYVVMPHGVYEAPIRRSLKGSYGIRARMERLLLEEALAVHVFFPSERQVTEEVAPKAVFVVAATGFEPGNCTWTGGGGYFAWLGRYDPDHKGLDLLLTAYAAMNPPRPPLRFHGYDYNGGLARVNSLIRQLHLTTQTSVAGPLAGAEKDAFIAKAELYFHPSRWESHSIALLENLAAGVPMIVSCAIHIAAELAVSRAAVVCDFRDPADVDRAVRELLHEQEAFSMRARSYVRSRFAWVSVMELWDLQLGALLGRDAQAD